MTGKPLNVVADQQCPRCFQRGPMTVWAAYVSWPCGHARELPPLPSNRAAPGRKAAPANSVQKGPRR